MKRVLFAAIAMCAMVFASCENEGGGKQVVVIPPGEEKGDIMEIVLRLDFGDQAEAQTRMITAPGATGQLRLNDGHIFIINNAGSVVQHVALDVPAASSAAGQTLTTQVSSAARVYIIGNVPSTVQPNSINSYAQIQSTVVNMQAAGQTDYTKAMLANQSGEAMQITTGGTVPAGQGTVTVPLAPLYSRLELAQVSGGPNIVSFTVTGVFVDRYYSSFTLTGASSGTVKNQSTSTDFSDNIGDNGTWASTGAAGSAVAVPAQGQSWTYHMAADDLPRFIVRVTNVVWNDSGTQRTLDGTRYITVTGYSGNAPAKFERGKIYQVANIQFTENNAAMTPNPTNVTLNVKTQVVDWVLTPLTPTLARR